MATSYSAGQYNQEFQPKRMQMHQVPAAQLSQVKALISLFTMLYKKIDLLKKKPFMMSKVIWFKKKTKINKIRILNFQVSVLF
jgi:hypothetical protein